MFASTSVSTSSIETNLRLSSGSAERYDAGRAGSGSDGDNEHNKIVRSLSHGIVVSEDPSGVMYVVPGEFE